MAQARFHGIRMRLEYAGISAESLRNTFGWWEEYIVELRDLAGERYVWPLMPWGHAPLNRPPTEGEVVALLLAGPDGRWPVPRLEDIRDLRPAAAWVMWQVTSAFLEGIASIFREAA